MKKGFTLIELLVVIAIIGILASIVLVSLGTARNKAKDVAIKADLSGLRSAAELYSTDNGDAYTGFCTELIEDGGDFLRVKASVPTALCNDSADVWAVCAPLIGDTGLGNKYFCVDYNGTAKDIDTAAAVCTGAWAATVCP